MGCRVIADDILSQKAFPVKTRSFVRWARLRALDETSTLMNLPC